MIFNVWQPVPDPSNLPFDLIGFRGKDYFRLRLSSEEEWQNLVYEQAIPFSDSDERLGLEAPSFNIQISDSTLEGDFNLYEVIIRIVLEKDHLPVNALGADLNEESGF